MCVRVQCLKLRTKDVPASCGMQGDMAAYDKACLCHADGVLKLREEQ